MGLTTLMSLLLRYPWLSCSETWASESLRPAAAMQQPGCLQLPSSCARLGCAGLCYTVSWMVISMCQALLQEGQPGNLSIWFGLDVCRFEEAQRLCKSAIMILEKSVGEEDVNVAAALSLQATCLQYAPSQPPWHQWSPRPLSCPPTSQSYTLVLISDVPDTDCPSAKFADVCDIAYPHCDRGQYATSIWAAGVWG